MYNLPYHKEQDQKVVKAFLDKYPFAFLSGCDAENKPVGTQVPLFFEERDGNKFLRGHLMHPQKNTALVPKHLCLFVSRPFSQGARALKTGIDPLILSTSTSTFTASVYITPPLQL